MKELENLHAASYAVICSGAGLIILILLFNFYALWIGAKKIFEGSGSPISMAETLLSSIQTTSQFLFGVFIVSLLSVLIIQTVLSTEVGIPIITSVVGFLLGRIPGAEKNDKTIKS